MPEKLFLPELNLQFYDYAVLKHACVYYITIFNTSTVTFWNMDFFRRVMLFLCFYNFLQCCMPKKHSHQG